MSFHLLATSCYRPPPTTHVPEQRRVLRSVAKWSAVGIAIVVLGTGLAYLLRGDPWGPIAGKGLWGEEVEWPADWAFTAEIPLAELEVRPDQPHSVTTLTFVHDGALYVPAARAASKIWPLYLAADSRIRIKIDGQIYLGRARRDYRPASVFAPALSAKYPQIAARLAANTDAPSDSWFFRIDPR